MPSLSTILLVLTAQLGVSILVRRIRRNTADAKAAVVNAQRELVSQAKEAFFARDCARAVELYTKAIDGAPNDMGLYANRASCLADLGQHDAALVDHARALEIARAGRGKGHEKDAALMAIFFYNTGVTLSQSGNERAAIREFKTALEVDPYYPDAANNIATLLLETRDSDLRDVAQAVGYAEDECARSHNENADHLQTLLAAYTVAGNLAKAEATREILAALQPADS